MYDAIVLGAGLYGVKTALVLKRLGLSILLVDPSEQLFTGATLCNQNRIHQGFHYPRSLATAMTARKYYDRFLIDYAPAVAGNERHLYVVASESKVNATDFNNVMSRIGAHFKPISTPDYFTPGMIEASYETHELSFDITKMRELMLEQLKIVGVEIINKPAEILVSTDDYVEVKVGEWNAQTKYLFNCTYANIDKIVPIRTKLKKEHVEMVLVDAPDFLKREDVTVMDGPFFSIMRYPPNPSLAAITHVLHGRHNIWFPPDPEPVWERKSKGELIISDISRFIPEMAGARIVGSLYTTRVLLAESKEDDGRPVLWEYATATPRVISILGSKFNSIYDVEDELVKGEWDSQPKTSVKKVGRKALIGRGLVASNIDRPGRFTDRYHTQNIHEMSGHYDLIVCAAPSGTKWKANDTPAQDWTSVSKLIETISHVTADNFVLISTIDATKENAYGKNRKFLENAILDLFPKAIILRLPALFGPGLKKNVLYDLMNGGMNVNAADVYQWFNLTKLWRYICHYLSKFTPGVFSLYSEPIPTYEICRKFFPDRHFWLVNSPAYYNEPSSITLTKEEIFLDMGEFIQHWEAENVN